MIERISPDNLFMIGGGAIALMLVWTFVRNRLRFKMPRKWVVTLCVILSIIFHIALLLVLPGFPGDKGTGLGLTSSPAPDPWTTIAVAAVDDGEVKDSQTNGDGELTLNAPPLPAVAPEIAAPTPQPRSIPTQAPQIVNTPNPATEQTTSSIDAMLSELLLADAPSTAPDPKTMAVHEPSQQPLVNTNFDANAQWTNNLQSSQTNNFTPNSLAAAAPSNAPHDFSNRDGTSRLAAIRNFGGDERTEAAVEAALLFLTQSQEADGRWSAAKYGAGREEQVLGQYRNGAGKNADAGVTGLSLLAMLGRGITPSDPRYGGSLMRGLSWLRSVQRADGSLAAAADNYSAMYSHGIASLAVMEAYAMTQDPVLRQMALSAMSYTVRSQHPVTGGWRYFSGEPGDLSQLGWQAMALQTGTWAGLPVPESTKIRMEVFLNSVRSGRAGGLAAYRPGERATTTMTAEALATRLLLGLNVTDAEAQEAEAVILAERPGIGRDNLYFWYYASLALHQRGSAAWDPWNQAMKSRLLVTQSTDGSWPTETVWGGYGGKIYTTSISALCLEVYYRHLSVYRGSQAIAAQPPGNSFR